MISEKNCGTIYSAKQKGLQTIIAIIYEDEVTELNFFTDDFCKFFDSMMEKYTLQGFRKRNYHCDTTLSKTEVMLILHSSNSH